MNEYMTLMQVDGEFYPIYIEYKKRNRNMYLRINEDGSLHVTCPNRVSLNEIQHFIDEKTDWILKTTKKQNNKINHIKTGSDGKYATFLGKTYPVEFYLGKRNSMQILDDRIVFVLTKKTKNNIDKTFYHEAVNKLKEIVEDKRVDWDWHICRENFLPYPNIKYRFMISQWGNCKPSRNEIVLSTRLIHFPIESIESVLLHEYVHLLVPNHSNKFYNIVYKYMPEYKTYSDYLK